MREGEIGPPSLCGEDAVMSEVLGLFRCTIVSEVVFKVHNHRAENERGSSNGSRCNNTGLHLRRETTMVMIIMDSMYLYCSRGLLVQITKSASHY